MSGRQKPVKTSEPNNRSHASSTSRCVRYSPNWRSSFFNFLISGPLSIPSRHQANRRGVYGIPSADLA